MCIYCPYTVPSLGSDSYVTYLHTFSLIWLTLTKLFISCFCTYTFSTIVSTIKVLYFGHNAQKSESCLNLTISFCSQFSLVHWPLKWCFHHGNILSTHFQTCARDHGGDCEETKVICIPIHGIFEFIFIHLVEFTRILRETPTYDNDIYFNGAISEIWTRIQEEEGYILRRKWWLKVKYEIEPYIHVVFKV